MKLIIDIPEDALKEMKTKEFISIESLDTAIECIKNGTPLPKGHGRLIDADVLVDGMEDDYEFCEAVNATPTIIEADKESEDKE